MAFVVCIIFQFCNLSVSCQKDLAVYKIDVASGSSYGYLVEKLKTTHRVMIAYDNVLNHKIFNNNVIVQSENIDTLILKLACLLNLESRKVAEKEYLLRENSSEISEWSQIYIEITDQNTGLPAQDVLLSVDSTDYYAFTDKFGVATLKLPLHQTHNRLRTKSFDHQENIISIEKGKYYYNVKLTSQPITIPSVKITTPKQAVQNNLQSNSVKGSVAAISMINNSSAFGLDVFRAIQMFSGVNAVNDASANLQIRGGATEATLLMLDGMPIYKADHFYGIISAINGLYISDFVLYKNNIPVEFGGKTSGMFQMNSKRDIEKPSLVLDINSLFTSGKAEIALAENMGIKLAGRYTYSDLITTGLNSLAERDNIPSELPNMPVLSNLLQVKPVFNFYDLNGSMYFNTGLHRFSLDGFMSKDNFLDSRLTRFRTSLFTANEELFKQTNQWTNQSWILAHHYKSDKFELKSRLYYSGYSNNYGIYSLLRQQRLGEVFIDTVDIQNDNIISDFGFSTSYQNFEKKFSLGFETTKHQNELYLENASNPLLEINNEGIQYSLFGEKVLNFSNGKWEIKPAFRFTYLPSISRQLVLPQIYTHYKISSHLLLKASAGRQMQYIRLLEHENNLGQSQQFFAISNNSSIPLGIARNYMAGAVMKGGKLSFDIEFYRRNLNGAITHASVRPGLRNPQSNQTFADYRIFNGDSKTIGTDFSVVYDQPSFFSMISYTLSKSENRFREIFNNQYFPSSEDSRHQLKWVNTYKWKSMEFSGNYIGASGRPYLDLTLLDNIRDRSNLNISEFVKNLDAYNRIDLGIAYHLSLFGFKSKIGLSVFNVTNLRNVKYRQFIFRIPTQNNNVLNTVLGADVTQLDRTFNFSFTMQIE
ncbi:MAG: hypothetical protein IPM42_19420 [Saprospiraceae bacterium]|nr:hypothetical protein [Saprospiraceae bacterium]